MKQQVHPWDMQSDESMKEYIWFNSYRSLGMDRTYALAARPFGKTAATFSKVGRERQWEERARAWDIWKEEQLRKAEIDEIAKMRTRHSAMAMEMVEAAHTELRAMAEYVKKKQADLEERRLLEPDAVRKPVLSTVDIVRLGRTGAHLERLTRGESTANVQVTEEYDTSMLSVEELRVLNILMKKMEGHDVELPEGPSVH